MNYTGQKIAVLGAGQSGLAAARLASLRGADVTVIDSGNPTLPEGTKAILGEAAHAVDADFDLVISSPGIDPAWPIARQFVGRGLRVIGELEFAASELHPIPIVAITGTNGKTTTTELTAAVLNGAMHRTLPCANYGEPLSSVALRHETYDVLTAEVSSFQLELVESFHPEVAVWLNFAPDHLDRHPTLDAYRAAKLRIFENQTADDWAIVRFGEDAVDLGALAARTLTFSAYDPAADLALDGTTIRFRGEAVLDMRETRLQGRHNAENAMAALAVGHVRGIPFAAMVGALATHRPSAHRCEPVAIIDQVVFINDSKSTNVHALESALRALDGPVVLIAGGKDKGLDYAPLARLVSQRARAVVAIGEIAPVLEAAWGSAVATEIAPTLEEAVQRAAALASPGDVVLFSPGTSSFDMFSGYAERGDRFRTAAAQLGPAPAATP
ncbi:UDP-N-acetylmuramoyl-L-alanine--D-glutamate ligase [soil metagenome]